ncbi:uncharacterized protein F5Z01DRAFT_279810 [Emericellopsis atlantica]|uniref:Oxidoreductase n=1 Tax=Emericellopsis atlantica TaxID=2614577 RepID=A0A9P7ZH92_9HYPO|nr:uncharacterized protein F5Z01DRAFT_279810 [Emericellopsis atlantica]KAG9251418.1 hypothetical protein F5Z01DRAFT_279810 [Emericellopsis atlantica]
MTIQVGVVGYGNAAKSFHIPFVQAVPAYTITAVLQRAEAPVEKSPGSHCTVDLPGVRHHRTAEAFFADKDIDLVVVATRNDTHIEFAEKALLAGKHAIVDKPFAQSSADADRVIKLADEKGLILTVFQNRRWDSDFRTLQSLLAKNALGKIMEAELHYDFEAAPWLKHMTAKEYTPGAGHAFGLGTHNIDQAYVLFGRPKSVTAFFRSQRGIDSEVEDSFTIILQYADEKLVTVKTCVVSCMEKQLKQLIRGTEGSWIKWQQRSTCTQEEQIAQGVKPLDPAFGKEPPGLEGTLTTYKEFDASFQTYQPETNKYSGQAPSLPGHWVGLYESLADAILGKGELQVKASEARDVLRIIELARESHEKGVTVAWK